MVYNIGFANTQLGAYRDREGTIRDFIKWAKLEGHNLST